MNPRILIAGIGNIFLGDDAFGVEVAQRLTRLAWPDHVHVKDFGIRGFDLCYALMDDYDAFILIDAVPRGGEPGTSTPSKFRPTISAMTTSRTLRSTHTRSIRCASCGRSALWARVPSVYCW